MRQILFACAAALALSACADYGPGYGYDSGGYNAYYDDAYGPFYDGYWGRDNLFWYSTGRGRPYVRDDGHHFHHEADSGTHGVHGGHHMFHRH